MGGTTATRITTGPRLLEYVSMVYYTSNVQLITFFIRASTNKKRSFSIKCWLCFLCNLISLHRDLSSNPLTFIHDEAFIELCRLQEL